MPDRLHKHLSFYYDHSGKVANCRSLTNKHLMAAVHGLLSMFRVTSPLDNLQSDNAGEFINVACNSKTACFILEKISIVVTYYY